MSLNDHSIKLALNYAKHQTKHYSKSFFLSASLLPKEKRWDTFALYNFCRYADNIIDKPRNRSVEELKMEIDHLAKEIETAYKYGESEHPVVKSFAIIARKYQIPIKYPLELLEGVKMDLTIRRYDSFNDLYLFCYRVAGVVGIMMTYVLGFSNKRALYFAEKLGIAMQLTNILRDIKEDKNMGRIYLPAEELTKFNLTYEDIENEVFNKRVQDLVTFQINRANRYYKESQDGVKYLNMKTQFAITSASKIYQSILLKLEARNHNPFVGRVFVRLREKLVILIQELFKTRFWNPVTTLFT
jgi:phytoene synthase